MVVSFESVYCLSRSTMATTNSIFIILSCLAVLIQSQSINDNWCRKSWIQTRWYRPLPAQCCRNQENCNTWIGPKETKFGLTNPDPESARRLCSCDVQFYECITSGLRAIDKADARRAFGDQTCFRRTIPRLNNPEEFVALEYEFVSLRDVIPNYDVDTRNLDLSLFEFKST